MKTANFKPYEWYKALEKPKASIYGKGVQTALLINVMINIAASLFVIFIDIDSAVKSLVLNVEYFTVVIFCIELICRYLLVGYDVRYKGMLGRLRYTLTPFVIIDLLSLLPYFIIGINFNSLLARIFRFLKFFRLLKLLRLRDIIRKIFSLNFFASTSIAVQFLILLLFSALFISVFSLTLKDSKLSAMIFLDPVAITEAASYSQVAFGFLELILGLVVGGTLISIISSLLTNVLDDVKNGYYPYKGKNHIILVNNNDKVSFILKEINSYYFEREESKDVVLFLPFVKDIEAFYQEIKKFSSIRTIVIKGNPFIWNTYEKLSINNCDRMIFLQNQDGDSPYVESVLTRFILSNEKFTNQTMKFTIESNSKKNKQVYEEVFSQSANLFNIINSDKVIQSVLNRSIVDPTYFDIYLNLLSFDKWNIDVSKYHKIFVDDSISYQNLCLRLEGYIAIGIIRDREILLNPHKDTLVTGVDEIISIQKNESDYQLLETVYSNDNIIQMNCPKLKIYRKICIVGDYDGISINKIDQFLNNDSIKELKNFILEDEDDYLSLVFWDDLISQGFDMIILNLEDYFEFTLTMYLRNSYKHNSIFLDSIVNIVHDPIYEKLLHREAAKNHTILSDKITAEYIAQSTFNPYMIDIFKEITHSHGNEFYTLDKVQYAKLFDMTILNVKFQLLENGMSYVGAIVNDKFTISNKNVASFEKIVVLGRGG